MSVDGISRVAVIGAGTIGASWVALFLAQGLEVSVFDPVPESEERVRGFVAAAWPALQALGTVSGPVPKNLLRFAGTATDAVKNADFVQESGPENPALKTPLLTEVDAALAPGRVIASSSSGLTLAQLRDGLNNPERVLIGHPFNPPHLIPLVEVVADGETLPAALAATMDFYRALGKTPIHLKRSVPGHVANRLQAAIWREAVSLLDQGVASLEDIDLAVSSGPGLRWAIFGPSATFHLGGGPGGMEDFITKLGGAVESWWSDLADFDRLTPSMTEKLIDGTKQLPDWDDLRMERDRRLVEILRLSRSAEPRP